MDETTFIRRYVGSLMAGIGKLDLDEERLKLWTKTAYEQAQAVWNQMRAIEKSGNSDYNRHLDG